MTVSSVGGGNHRPVDSHWPTLLHNVTSSTPRHERDSNSQALIAIKMYTIIYIRLNLYKEVTFGTKKHGYIRQVTSWNRFNSYEIFNDRTRRRWSFKTGDCLIEVIAWGGLTVYYMCVCVFFNNNNKILWINHLVRTVLAFPMLPFLITILILATNEYNIIQSSKGNVHMFINGSWPFNFRNHL